MRLLQDISALDGIDASAEGFPGKWTDLTHDCSIQIINLGSEALTDTSLYENDTKEDNGKIRSSDIKVNNGLWRRDTSSTDAQGKLDTEYLSKTFLNLESVVHQGGKLAEPGMLKCYDKNNITVDRKATDYSLFGKGWSSDTCLSYHRTTTKKNERKQYSSTGNLATENNKAGHEHSICKDSQAAGSEVKPILRKVSKRRKRIKKTVSFKESGPETRFFVKCELTDSDSYSTEAGLINRCSAFEEENIEYRDVNKNTSDVCVSPEDRLIVKSVTQYCEMKLAKVVQCKSTTSVHTGKSSTRKDNWRESLAAKRKLTQCQGETFGNADPEVEHSIFSDLYSELADKIPKYCTKMGRNNTDIGPLSNVLMEIEKQNIINTNSLSKSCSDIYGNENQYKATETVLRNETDNFRSGYKIPCRLGTSNLRSVRCQRRLSFSSTVNEANILDISDTDYHNGATEKSTESTILYKNKPMRPRLGVHCKVSKPVELDSLDIGLVCDLKKKLTRGNRVAKIKTNGSLKYSEGHKSSFSSPKVKCFKRTVRPSPCSLKVFTPVSRLETYV